MKYIYIIILTIIVNFSYSQAPGCPNVDVGSDILKHCDQNCVDLSATFLQTGLTGHYGISAESYANLPFPFTGGNSIPISSDDDWSNVITLPFNFCFFGSYYNQVIVGDNGIISFDLTDAGGYCPWSFSSSCPSSSLPTNAIFGVYHDAYLPAGGTMWYDISGTYPCRMFTFKFNQVAQYSCNGNKTTTEIVLYETTNVIEVYVHNIQTCSWNSGSHLIGIQNAGGSVGFTPPGRNTGSWSATDECWRFTPDGGPNYTIQWFENGSAIAGATNASVNVCPTVPSNYEIQVTYHNCDGNNVMVHDDLDVDIASLDISNISSTPLNCHDGTNGSLTVGVTTNGGTSFNYNWDNASDTGPTSSTTNTVTGVGANTYSVTVTDNNGCTDNDNVTIINPPALVVNLTPTDESCNGADDGEISVSISNGNTPYDITWTPGTTVNNQPSPYDITNLSDNSYIVSVQDNNGCTGTASVTINQGPDVVADILPETNQCLNGNSFTFDGSGSTPSGGTYSWDFGDGNTGTGATPSHSYATDGTYTVTLTYTNGSCFDSEQISVQVYPHPNASAVEDHSVSCNGLSDGQATASGGGNYLWPSGTTTATETGLSAGTYTVTVTSSVGNCPSTADVTITEPTALVITVSNAPASCYGNSDGTAVCDITTASTSPYDYEWSTGDNTMGTTSLTESLNTLSAGSYDITVTDAHNCSEVMAFTISQPTPWNVSYSVVDATCGNASGSIDLTVNSGNTGPYSYLWSGGETSEDLTNILAGAYTVTISDNTVCDTVIAISVADAGSPIISIDGHTDPFCNGSSDGTVSASLTTTTSANYTYTWSSGTGSPSTPSSSTTTTVSGVGAGTITVQVTDGNGCTASDQIILSEPTAIIITVDSIHDANCGQPDGDIYISVTGGTVASDYTYSWNTNPVQSTQDATGVLGGTYTIDVTDDNSCPASLSGLVVGDNPPLQIAGSIISNPLCLGDCNAVGEVTITTVTTGPYDFVWDNGLTSNLSTNELTDTVDGLCAVNTYNVTVTDANGCTAITNIKPSDPTLLIAAAVSTNIDCFGGNNGTATASAHGGTPGYSYSWDGGMLPQNEVDTGLISGTYIVTVTDANGCTDTASVTITEPSQLTLSVNSYTDESCNASNGDITTITTGGTTNYSYLWDNGAVTADITGLIGGVTYWLTVTDANGCTAITNQYIDSIPPGVATITNTTDITCNGFNDGTATVTIVGGSSNFDYSWGNGYTENGTSNVSSTVTGLSQGVISVSITDANNCVITASSTINEPAQLVNVFTVDTLECNSYCDASISTSITGGIPGYTYSWNTIPVLTTSSIDSLCAGSYTVVVTDTNNCTITESVTIDAPPAMSLSAVTTNSSCNQSDGSIDLTVTNTSGTMTYYWEEGANPGIQISSNEDLVNVAAGSYFVTVTNGSGCEVTGNWDVIDDSAPVAVMTDSSDVTCYGDDNGYATVTVTGGTGVGTYTYLWNNGEVTATASNLSGGSYSVIVTDANNCQATAGVTIYEPPYLNFTLNTYDPLCSGGTDGWASVTPYGGTPGYSYIWTGSGTNPNDSLFTNLGDGLYTIQITDANGCDTILNNIQINEPPAMSASSVITEVTCNGYNDGEINLTVIGGTESSSYDYIWDNNAGGQTTNPAVGLGGGIYSVSVYDDNNCELIYSTTVNEPTQMVIDSLIPTDLSCFQSGDGIINVHVTDGTPGYSFNWETGSNPGVQYSANEDLANLNSDTYFLTVTDNNGCTVDTSVIINQPLQLTLSLSPTDETCYGYCDGEVSSIVTGGTQIAGSYDFLWSNNDVTQDLVNACPGTYTLQVTDANGCTISGTETVNGSPQLFINVLDITDATCGDNNGEITIDIGGGSGIPVIDWSPIVNNANALNLHNSHVIDLPSGNHYLQITDANGCQIDTSLPLNNVGGPVLDSIVTVDVTCFGDCDGSVSVYYHQPVNAAPPYTLSWDNNPAYTNNTTLDSRCEGTYYWEVSDINGCIISGSGYVGSPTELTSAFVSSNNVTCNGVCNGDATVNVNGGTAPYTYTWTDGVNNTSAGINLCAGIHNVLVTDDHGCTSQSNVNITEPTPLSIDSVSGINVSCSGLCDGVICIQGSGGSGTYYYQWFGANSTASCASDLCAGNTVTVSLTDQNDVNCSVSASFVVDEPAPLELSTSSIPTHCNGANGEAVIDNITGGTAPYSINWSPCTINCSNMNLTGLTNSIYQAQVTDANGCTSVAQVQVDDKPIPYLYDQIIEDANCNGLADGYAKIRIDGGQPPYNYFWSPSGGANSDSSNTLLAGTYTVLVQDADGCEVSTVFTINEPDPITVFADGPATPVCIDQATNLTVSANGGTPQYTYIWSDTTLNGQTVTAQPHQSSSYSVYVIDANGCQSNSSQVTVQVYPPIHVVASPDQTICSGESTNISATATGGNGSSYTYNWIPVNGSTTSVIPVSPINTTTYTVWASDLCNSPSDTASTIVNIAYAPQVLSIKGGEGCEPLGVAFDVVLADTTLNVSYQWNFGNAGSSNSSLSNPVYTYDNEGFYDVSLRLTSINGCVLDTTVDGLVKVYPVPEAIFSSDKQVVSIFNSEVEFTDNSDGFGYPLSNMWDFGDTTAMDEGVTRVMHRYKSPGVYTVMLYVTNQYGCVDSTSGLIQVEQEHTFYMPNAFRPNLDKWFYPKGIGINTGNYKFTVYNRWGEPIFETKEYPEGTDQVDRLGTIEGGWNGKYNNTGKYVQDGVYVWIVELEDVNGYMHEYSGVVNVIR